MSTFWKVLGYTLLVIAALFLIGPWLVNFVEMKAIADCYESYCNFVRSVFGH